MKKNLVTATIILLIILFSIWAVTKDKPDIDEELVKKINSSTGAFFIGIFVTIFLLPCTIGPYIIALGLLSGITFIKTIPWLLYYNILFVIPMLIIINIVYKGFAKVEEVSGWKERNIRMLHLIAGILLFTVGLSLLMDLVVKIVFILKIEDTTNKSSYNKKISLT